ncbi:MAG TPA: ABC transporter permease [Rhodothermales bacterium]|nr:ABC transporter permease [Rhodothermales bacterium]
MTSFQGFVTKEVYHIFRDRRTLLILFGMPVIMLTLFGFAIRNEIADIQVAVLDRSHDVVTEAIVSELLASPYFEGAALLQHVDEIEQAFQQGAIKEAILFEPQFAQRLHRDGMAQVMVITDATDPNTASTMLAYTSAILQDYQQRTFGAGGGVRIVPEVRMRFNPELKSVNLFVPGLMALILMLVSALMTSITNTREKEMGTMEVLLVSPLRPVQIIIGKVLPYLLLSFVNVVTILVLARFVFGVPVRGNVALLLAECLLFILCALALGILISTRSQTQQTATMISLAGLLLPTVILSGFIFPISSMPLPLQYLSHIVPAKWFLLIVRDIMLKGVGLAYFWQETLILAGMTVILMAASIRNFKVRLE